jgi:hypothetical protein
MQKLPDSESFEARPLWRFLHPEFSFTKRQIGLLLLLIGGAGFLLLLLLDVVGMGREGGFGPAQRAGLGIFAAAALLGLTLIPLGDVPA